MKKSQTKYNVYEHIRDSNEITESMSNTKKIISKLMQHDKQTEEYCNRKTAEEKQEVEAAIVGKHYHENMTQREILVNEISQYMYWKILLAVSKYIEYKEFDEEATIKEILKQVDIAKIGETKEITVNEIIVYDLEQMSKKEYLKKVIGE